MNNIAAVNHSTLVRDLLIDAGYTFDKDMSNNQWVIYDGEQQVGTSRSLGDLIRKQGTELGIW